MIAANHGGTGSVCCVAWKDDQQFATASADHVIQLHSGDQTCMATLRGDAAELTHLTWSPNGNYHKLILHGLARSGTVQNIICVSTSMAV